MGTSVGYHTFVIARPLTQEEADRVFKDFKKYRDTTGKIEIVKQKTFKNDPNSRHYSIVYPNQEKGLSWRIRFSNKGFYTNGGIMPCSIKAIINPKILTGERSYIVAADASYLNMVRHIFDMEASAISPLLKSFYDYSLNRIDYCVNFDVSELRLKCPPELEKALPGMIMKLIKCGDIPTHFKEEYNDEFQFYLKCESIVVNCYWKHDDLRRNFYSCIDLDNSYNIIRFEVQYRYPKVISTLAKIKRENADVRSALSADLTKQGYFDFDTENTSNSESSPLLEKYRETCLRDEIIIMRKMLSDLVCLGTIKRYFYDVIKRGDYFTFDTAKRIIEREVSRWEKVVRLTDTLKLISDLGGIAKAKATLKGKQLDEFRRSLRDLADLNINPVTIPNEWHIEFIPNLMRLLG